MAGNAVTIRAVAHVDKAIADLRKLGDSGDVVGKKLTDVGKMATVGLTLPLLAAGVAKYEC